MSGSCAVLDDALPQLNAVLLDAHNVTRVWSGQCSRKWWSRRSRSRSCSWLRQATARRQELIDQAWAEAQQDGRFGGCGLGGHAQTTDASFAAAVLSVYPSLRDTVALRGMPLLPGGRQGKK